MSATFPLPTAPRKPRGWSDERLTAVVQDILAGHTVRAISEKHSCASWMVSNIRNGKYHPDRVLAITERLQKEQAAPQPA